MKMKICSDLNCPAPTFPMAVSHPQPFPNCTRTVDALGPLLTCCTLVKSVPINPAFLLSFLFLPLVTQ